jgi:SulP family sulfate permease
MNDINNRAHLRGDFFGGLASGIVALPLVLAFGVQSGMGAIAGLYGAIAIGVLAAWFGGTPAQISGPTGSMTVVAAVIINTAIETSGSLNAAMGTIFSIFMLAGIFQVFLGLLKAGKYFRYIPRSVVTGFISGIGILLIIWQIFPFLGHPSPNKTLDIFAKIPDILNQINYVAVLLTTATIVIIYSLSKISKTIPSSFVALVILTVTSAMMGLNVSVIADIHEGLSELKITAPSLFNWFDLSAIILPAMSLAVLGAIVSLLTTVVADNETITKYNSNKEMIGQGIGNMASAAIGGIPGAGATLRTAANINAGGTTRISGVIHSILLLIILLSAGTYIQLIPLPVFAGILITVGINLINYKEMKRIIFSEKTDAVIMLIILGLTVFVDLFQAMIIGIAMASILFMKSISEMMADKSVSAYSKDFIREKAWPDEADFSELMQKKVFIKHLEGSFFLGLANTLLVMTHVLPDIEIVIMRMKKVSYIDQIGLFAIQEAVAALQDKNIVVLITGLQHQPLDMLTKVHMIPYLIAEENLYTDFQSAINTLVTSSDTF